MAPPQHQNTSFDTYRLAHALVTAVAFLFFAVGGIWLRFSKAKHAVQYHAYFQIFNTALVIVGFGFGVYLCQINPPVSNPSNIANISWPLNSGGNSLIQFWGPSSLHCLPFLWSLDIYSTVTSILIRNVVGEVSGISGQLGFWFCLASWMGILLVRMGTMRSSAVWRSFSTWLLLVCWDGKRREELVLREIWESSSDKGERDVGQNKPVRRIEARARQTKEWRE